MLWAVLLTAWGVSAEDSSCSFSNSSDWPPPTPSPACTHVSEIVCDNVDDDCNSCTDEGFPHYCLRGQPCCNWATAAQRTTCFNNYIAGGSNNPSLLPCTTLAQQADPTRWLCVNPGEQCDGVDNNCDGRIDEGCTAAPTTLFPTTLLPTTVTPTTVTPTTVTPTTVTPTTVAPTTVTPTTVTPTTVTPTTMLPTTRVPTHGPSTGAPTSNPTTNSPTHSPTRSPSTGAPTTAAPSQQPTSSSPTLSPTTSAPTPPTTLAPSHAPTTVAPSSRAPSTKAPASKTPTVATNGVQTGDGRTDVTGSAEYNKLIGGLVAIVVGVIFVAFLCLCCAKRAAEKQARIAV